MLLDEFSGVGEVADEGFGPWICTPLKDDGGHDATTRLLACQGVLRSGMIRTWYLLSYVLINRMYQRD